MIANCVKIIFSLLLLASFVIPGTAAGLPASPEPQPDHSLQVVEIPLTGTLETTDPAALPPTEVSVNVKANKAVYIDEENPITNMNSGAQRAHLRVGTSPEFGYKQWTLLSFYPVKKSQGGLLPNDAEITRAKIKMYKESGAAGTVSIHTVGDDFNEGTVNWNTKPHMSAGDYGSASVPAANGWCYLDMPVSLVNDALNFNRAVRAALHPTWTNANKSVSFHSNEHPSLGPVLVIYYKGKAAPPGATPAPTPAPTPPAPAPGDTTPCTLSYTVTPTNPRPGQRVTITARATDNQAMYYLTIMRGSAELARRDAASGQRELEVSYSENAQLPSLSYQIFADDLSPSASPVGRTVTVPVTGSGTAPTVTVTAEWVDVERVIPDRYRLIKNDGQRVRITAEASDPDGIQNLYIFINGRDHPFTYTGQTSVSQTVEWVNNNPTRTRFYYYAQARDREGQTTTGEGGDYHIAQPQDIRLIWHEAPDFQNFALEDIGFELPWERMCQIFGDDECWDVESWGWRDPSAWSYYEDHVRRSGWGGQCFGFSTLAAEIYNGRIAASELDNITGGAWELTYNNGYTGEWIQARQGGWNGEEVLIPRYNRGTIGARGTLNMVEYALETDDPGIIDIREGDGAHAVVPWMVRYMADDTVRIYIYDCNDVDGIHNPNADINNFAHYPFMVIDGRDWSYQWNATTVWNDDINYISYEEACGDMGQAVDPRIGPDAPFLTDHDIPNSTDWYLAWVSPGADAYFEDEQGNVTGMYKGQLREEIPGSMAVIPMMGGSFTEHEMYIVPRDKKLSIHAEGTGDGEYNLSLMGNATLYSIKKKKIRKGFEDLFGFEPWKGSLGYRFRIQPGVADDDFQIIVAVTFEGLVSALQEESVDREYIMEDVAATEDSDFAVHVEEGGDTLVVDNYGDDIQFDAVTRSTESANTVDPNQPLPSPPSSIEEDITLDQGRRAEITPENWATGEQRGNLHTLNKRAKGEGAGFPIIPVIIGAVILAAVGATIGILFGKGVLGKTTKA